jgi:hypothetical protein
MTKAKLICAAMVALVALSLPAAASARDRDRDHMPDRWEKKYGLNTHKNDARRDRDHDGLRNLAEYQANTNPSIDDSDGDGTEDGDEQAGTVKSFDPVTKTLTITLFGGGELTGLVTDATEIECDDDGTAANPTTPTGTTPAGRDDKVALRDGAAGTSGEDNSGDGQNGNDDGDNNDDQGGDDANCGPEALTQNRVVKEAEITGNGTSTTFKKVELAG